VPGGKRVGGEPLVHQAQRAGHIGIFQVLIESADLRRQQQALVDNRPRRKRGHIKHALVLEVRTGDFVLCAPTHHVELAFERIHIHAGGASNKELLDVRLGAARHPPNRGAIHRSVAPAQDRESFFPNDALQHTLALQPVVLLDREEDHANAIFARRWQVESQAGALAREELVGDLDQDAGAVARLGIAAAGPAVGQVDQDMDALDDNVVRLLALDAGDKADAASITLMTRIVEPLRLGKSMETIAFVLPAANLSPFLHRHRH